MSRIWTLAAVLVAAPLAAEIELPGCLAPPEVEAASRLPAELARRCGDDPACWRAGLDQARALAARFESSYDAHRIRVLVARAAARALGEAAIEAVAAEYRDLAARHAAHPAYPHLLAQLTLEGEPYESELERLALAHPDYPWAHLSLAYLLRPDSDDATRSRSSQALDRFVGICPLRYEAPIALLERSGDAEAWSRIEGRLRAAAVGAFDFEACARLWQLGGRFRSATPAASEGWLADVRRDLGALTAAGLPDELSALLLLRAGYELTGDAEDGARVDARVVELHPCSPAGRSRIAARIRPRLDEAAWLGLVNRRSTALDLRREIEPVLAACGDDESLLGLDIEALGLVGAEAGAELLAAIERWLALPGPRQEPAELWAAERLVEAGVALDRAAALLVTALALRSGPGSAEGEAADAEPIRRRELRLAAALALASGALDEARSRVEELRAATDASPPGSLGPAERALEERLEATLACALEPGAAALERWAALVATAPEGGVVEREARACWVAMRGDGSGFDEWRAGRSRVATVRREWREVDEAMPPTSLTDLGAAPFDLAAERGKTVFLRAWAGWCGPCREELAALEALARRFEGRDDVSLWLVSVDPDPSPVIALLARGALAVEPLLGGAGLLDAGFLARVPAAWILSPAGRVVRRQEGPAGDDAAAWIDAAAAAIAEVAATPSNPAPVAAP